ncbi:MAG: hypothetical protein ACRCW0_09705 [Clostridium sp.]
MGKFKDILEDINYYKELYLQAKKNEDEYSCVYYNKIIKQLKNQVFELKKELSS